MRPPRKIHIWYWVVRVFPRPLHPLRLTADVAEVSFLVVYPGFNSDEFFLAVPAFHRQFTIRRMFFASVVFITTFNRAEDILITFGPGWGRIDTITAVDAISILAGPSIFDLALARAEVVFAHLDFTVPLLYFGTTLRTGDYLALFLGVAVTLHVTVVIIKVLFCGLYANIIPTVITGMDFGLTTPTRHRAIMIIIRLRVTLNFLIFSPAVCALYLNPSSTPLVLA